MFLVLITILIILAITSFVAFLTFIKIPSKLKSKLGLEDLDHITQNEAEFAPLYSKSEQRKRLIVGLVLIVAIEVITKFWLKPWLEQYTPFAHCYQYGMFSGLELLAYGSLVGLPLFTTIGFFLIVGRRSIKVFQLGQDPLPDEKVFKRKKFEYGVKVKLRALALFAVNLCLLGFVILGYITAQELIKDLPPIDASSYKDLANCKEIIQWGL